MQDIKREIATRLDPKSAARMRAVSTEWKRAVNETHGPTGSYSRKSGRFQKQFSAKNFFRCESKIKDSTTAEPASGVKTPEFAEHARFMHALLTAAYKNKKLLLTFRESPKDLDGIRKQFRFDRFDPAKHDMRVVDGAVNAFSRWRRDLHRRVVKLIKAWARHDSRYRDTVKIVRRRTKPYTLQEEMKHRDRVMDAILVQLLARLRCDDPAKPAYDPSGDIIPLNDRVRMLVKECTSLCPR